MFAMGARADQCGDIYKKARFNSKNFLCTYFQPDIMKLFAKDTKESKKSIEEMKIKCRDKPIKYIILSRIMLRKYQLLYIINPSKTVKSLMKKLDENANDIWGPVSKCLLLRERKFFLNLYKTSSANRYRHECYKDWEQLEKEWERSKNRDHKQATNLNTHYYLKCWAKKWSSFYEKNYDDLFDNLDSYYMKYGDEVKKIHRSIL